MLTVIVFVALGAGITFLFIRDFQRDTRSPGNSTSILLLQGVITALAIAQMAAANGSDLAAAGTTGAISGIVVSALVAFGNMPMVRASAEYAFSAIALIALIPAIASLTGEDGCDDYANQAATIAALVVFVVAFAIVGGLMGLLGGSWSSLRYLGTGWFAFVELLLFWSAPAAASSVGGEAEAVAIALTAAVLCAIALAARPVAGLALLGVIIGAGALLAIGGDQPSATCSGGGNPDSAAVVVLSFFAVAYLCSLVTGRRSSSRRS